MSRNAPSRTQKSPAGDEIEPAGQPWRSVRKSQVARARRLIREPGYPSNKVLNSVARLLAKHLRHGN